MEINKDACGNFFLMIPTAGWKAKNAFHTYRDRPDGDQSIQGFRIGDQNEACLIAGERRRNNLS